MGIYQGRFRSLDLIRFILGDKGRPLFTRLIHLYLPISREISRGGEHTTVLQINKTLLYPQEWPSTTDGDLIKQAEVHAKPCLPFVLDATATIIDQADEERTMSTVTSIL